MPIEHVLHPNASPFLSGPVMTFVLILLGISIALTVVQTIQNRRFIQFAIEELMPRMNELLAQKNIEVGLRKSLEAKTNHSERAKSYANALRQTSKPEGMADTDWALVRRVQEGIFMQDRTSKKSFLLLLGVVMILAGLLVPIQKQENPMEALQDVAIPVGLLVIYLLALIYVRFQQKAPLRK